MTLSNINILLINSVHKKISEMIYFFYSPGNSLLSVKVKVYNCNMYSVLKCYFKSYLILNNNLPWFCDPQYSPK